MSTSLRIIFAGTSNFAVYHLNVLLSSGHKIIGIFTQPDKPAGRGKKITPTPVRLLGEKNKLPVFLVTSLLQQENQQLIATLNADIMIVVSYGLIIPQEVLKIPHLGCINVHGSLLPRWRGAAPIQRSLLAGDKETGVSIIQMDNGLDTGDILNTLSCPIVANDTTETLYIKLAKLGSQSLIKTLQQIADGKTQPKKQNKTQATYANKISKKEACIDWSLSAIQLERCVRAFNPWPISWIELAGHKIKIHKASVVKTDIQADIGTIINTNQYGIQVLTADGILNLELLQPENKKIMHARDFLNSSYKKWFIPGSNLI